MTKNFCDICGKPAAKWDDKQAVLTATERNRHEAVGSYRSRKVRIRVEVRTLDQDGEVIGPADVCQSCMSQLLNGTFYNLPACQPDPQTTT